MRKYTDKLIEMMENHEINPIKLAHECLSYMSEAEVEDMARSAYDLDLDVEELEGWDD
jgi:formate dehydrogenase maturation protein FdhE